MEKKYLIISLIIVLVVVAGFFWINYFENENYDERNNIENETDLDKLKICPDEWYDSRMPGVKKEPTQYFIINGERRELSEFDVNWIKNNCEVNEPTPVI